MQVDDMVHVFLQNYMGTVIPVDGGYTAFSGV
jgi:hypothetical protein